MGFNIGTRIVDEFFAKSPPNRALCRNFRETVEVIARDGFKMFLGIQGEVSAVPNPQSQQVGQEQTTFSIILRENPLSDFVILPPQYHKQLWYSNLLCGIIRGALEMINIRVTCSFVKDTLSGDQYNEIKVDLKEIIKEKYEDDD